MESVWKLLWIVKSQSCLGFNVPAGGISILEVVGVRLETVGQWIEKCYGRLRFKVIWFSYLSPYMHGDVFRCPLPRRENH